MKLDRFLLFSLAGMLPWNFVLILLGFQLGKRYDTLVHPIFKKFEYIVAGAVVLFVIYVILRNIKRHRENADAHGENPGN